jgi:ABC-type polar amino acid transport system ATPase subunit
MIKVSGLIKKFKDHIALYRVDLEVKQGEVKVIIGPSGSGKSTLLKCIAALEPFDHGKVRVGKLKIDGPASRSPLTADQETLRQLRLSSGFVFQQFNLFSHLTALENIVEAPVQVLKMDKAEAAKTAKKLLQQVHLENRADRYPRQLSGGEQQRVAIARALAMNPQCLLFDEPTSALDPEMVGEVLNVMRELAGKGMTLLIATHEMDFAKEVAGEILMLDKGRVIESGEPSMLFDNPKEERTRRFLHRITNRTSR